MKRFVIIFICLIVGYALYWCISDYNYRYNKINSIVGIYKLDFNHTDSEIYKDSIEKYNNLRLIPQIRNPTKVSERCGPNRQECDFSSLD